MKHIQLLRIFALFLAACAGSLVYLPAEAQNSARHQERHLAQPTDATSCDPELPIHVEMIPADQPQVGKIANFEVKVDSALDPDLVQSISVVYDLPPPIRKKTNGPIREDLPTRFRTRRLHLGVMIPDASRYAIRARLVVNLWNGRTISQTAIHWIDLDAEEPPDGMIGRLVDPDGTGVRIYQGRTVRN